MPVRPLMTHPEGEFTPLSEWSMRATPFGCRGEDHEDMGRGEDIKTRLPSNKVYVSSNTFMYPSIYIQLLNVEGWSTTLFHTYIIPSTKHCETHSTPFC